MTVRYCRSCSDFHDLDETWPEACYSHFKARAGASSIQIIKDIEPYKAVAIDVAQGKRPNIGSRREHREFLKRNGYVEMGHSKPSPKKWDYGQEVSGREIKQTIDQLRSQRDR